MKNLFKSMMLVAAAAMSFAACSKDAVEEYENGTVQNTEKITLSTEITRTTLNSAHTQLMWTAGDQFAVYTDKGTHNTPVTYTEGVANFDLEVAAGSKTVYAYYPYYENQSTTNDQNGVSIYVTSTQKQTEAGVFDGDKNDYVMIAKGEIDADKHVALTFRPVACAFALNIYGGEEGEKVKKVTFDPGVVCAGQHYMDLTAENLVYTAKDGKATSVTVEMGTPFAAEGAKPAADDYSRQVYAVVARKSYEGATFTVETDKTTYTFTTTSTLDLTTDFYTLNLNLAKGTKPEPALAQTYTLVTSLSDLNITDTYIIAGNNQTSFAGSTTMYVWDGSVNSSKDTQLNCVTTTADGTSITILPTQNIKEVQLESASGSEYYIKVNNLYLSALKANLSISSTKTAWAIKNDWNEAKEGFYLQASGCYVFCNSSSETAIRAYTGKTQYKGIYFFKKDDPNKKTLRISNFTATLNDDKTAVAFEGTYTSNYDEEPEWSISVSKDGTEIGTVGDVIGVDGEIAADDYTVTEDGTYTFTLTATIGGEVIASKSVTIVYTAKSSEYSHYIENFSSWSNDSATADTNGTEKGDACFWEYVGASSTYWSNVSSSSNMKSAVTILSPGKNGKADGTFILSEVLSGGIKNIKLTAISNNASGCAEVYIIDTDTQQTFDIGSVKTTSKKTDFAVSFDLAEKNIMGRYQIKITNHNNNTGYICIGNLEWNY